MSPRKPKPAPVGRPRSRDGKRPVHVWLPEEMVEALHAEATEAGQTLQVYIERILAARKRR